MHEKKKYISIGIDVCKGKWVAVALTEKGFEVNKFNNIEEICNKYEESDSIIVDIPIGLPENINDIRPEVEARKHLKGKTSSIFNVPCRQAVYLIDYESANEKNREILGKGLAKQSFGIASKIKEVDNFLNNNPKWKNKLQEGHPEICFSKLNNGEVVIENKTKLEGQQIRLDILKKYYSDSHLVIAKYLKDVPARKKIDDVIDALCLAVMGVIGLENGFETIPKEPMEDVRDIRMQMVYGKIKEDNKIKYDKLVRDKIPEIIKAQGRECEIVIADKQEKYKLLEAKLKEEVNEFLEDKNLEELADVMEVLFGLAEALGYSEEELLKARDKKREERGGFKEGIVLKSVR
jgi:predicted RNase H-like nuclease/predicted house-cleaning noncanonical NTP pyrophosphatase (MazG superfamily)